MLSVAAGERRQLRGTGARAPSTSNSFIFTSLWSKSESQLSKYCVVCEISWCRSCQQLTALSIGAAIVTELLVMEQLLHQTLKSTVSAPWHNFYLCPSSQQILATPLVAVTAVKRKRKKSNYARESNHDGVFWVNRRILCSLTCSICLHRCDHPRSLGLFCQHSISSKHAQQHSDISL